MKGLGFVSASGDGMSSVGGTACQGKGWDDGVSGVWVFVGLGFLSCEKGRLGLVEIGLWIG